MSIAIACAAGSFRGAFVHGVLSAFEKEDLHADAYAAASSSVVPASYATLGQIKQLGGAEHWKQGIVYLNESNNNISEVILRSIHEQSPHLRTSLFEPDTAHFLIATSAVITDEAAKQTQGEDARRLGQKLLLAIRRKDRSWADQHLALHLYGTLREESVFPLTAENLEAVIYASSRMLHAWKIPAFIDNRPYLDSSYTCSCPAIEMAELGFDDVIAIVPEPGPVYHNIFQSEIIPALWGNVPIHFIQPDLSLGELGVDYLTATPEGFDAVFQYGEQKGFEFLNQFT